ncbi:MAG: hypothetical protein RMK65_01830 [Anaerolineae bacterium]|nr:hypothetical protein [Anaerolineae bacterium]
MGKRAFFLLLALTLLLSACAPAAKTEPTATPPTESVTPIGDILSRPEEYVGKEVIVEGYDRGWDLLLEVGSFPPRTRSDRVIADPTGAIFYTLERPDVMEKLPLPPAWDIGSETVLRLRGRVERTDSGQPYLVISDGEVRQGLPSGVRLRIRRAGGFAGFDQELVVADNGAAVFVDRKARRTMRFSRYPDDVQILLKAARPFADQEVGGPVPDGLQYTLTVQEGDKGFAVVLHEGQLPAEAQNLLEILALWFSYPESALPPSTPEASVPEPVWAAVRALAERLGISESVIRVLSFKQVDWPDTSLGCPEPGMMFAQVITPGYRVVLEAAWETFEVHTDLTGRQVVFCPSEGVASPATEEAAMPGAVRAAIKALAERLQVPESAITVVSWEMVDWPDTSLGCPEPGMMCAQVITPGYRVVLEAEGKTHVAHTDRTGQRVVFCK